MDELEKEEKNFFVVELFEERRDRMVVEAKNSDEALERAYEIELTNETMLDGDSGVVDVSEGLPSSAKSKLRRHEKGWLYCPY